MLKQQMRHLRQQRMTCDEVTAAVQASLHKRYDVTNLLLRHTQARRYLEIGVRNPADNFDRIRADYKVSVDPGLEVKLNQATFPLTSDDFFAGLRAGKLDLACDRFDVVMIDGLHLAEQVYRDCLHAMEILASDGFLVIHDCNPPTVFHARENYSEEGPAGHCWNGTTWKAFQKIRAETDRKALVVDTDWGVGVVMNGVEAADEKLELSINPFYEYLTFAANRQAILNLCTFAELATLLESAQPARPA
jgi:hypothetical protein